VENCEKKDEDMFTEGLRGRGFSHRGGKKRNTKGRTEKNSRAGQEQVESGRRGGQSTLGKRKRENESEKIEPPKERKEERRGQGPHQSNKKLKSMGKWSGEKGGGSREKGFETSG